MTSAGRASSERTLRTLFSDHANVTSRARALNFSMSFDHPYLVWTSGRIVFRTGIQRLPPLATRDSQRDSHSSKIVDFDLQRVINAWRDLPANLKATILAIAGSG